jgi:hypothetical protein
MGCGKGLGKVFHQLREGARQSRRPGDENIIGTFTGFDRQERSRDGPKAPFGPVALDRAANLARGGEAKTKMPVPGSDVRGGADFEG